MGYDRNPKGESHWEELEIENTSPPLTLNIKNRVGGGSDRQAKHGKIPKFLLNSRLVLFKAKPPYKIHLCLYTYQSFCKTLEEFQLNRLIVMISRINKQYMWSVCM